MWVGFEVFPLPKHTHAHVCMHTFTVGRTLVNIMHSAALYQKSILKQIFKVVSTSKNVLSLLVELMFWHSICSKYMNTNTHTHTLWWCYQKQHHTDVWRQQAEEGFNVAYQQCGAVEIDRRVRALRGPWSSIMFKDGLINDNVFVKHHSSSMRCRKAWRHLHLWRQMTL